MGPAATNSGTDVTDRPVIFRQVVELLYGGFGHPELAKQTPLLLQPRKRDHKIRHPVELIHMPIRICVVSSLLPKLFVCMSSGLGISCSRTETTTQDWEAKAHVP